MTGASESARRRMYDAYGRWRRTSEYCQEQRDHNDKIFAGEMRRARVNVGDSVFEAGFGRGEFLSWASRQGMDIEGCEIVENYVEAARSQGYRVDHGSAADVLKTRRERYDLICMFDVLEHLSADAILELLDVVHVALKPGGRLFMRIPNGYSPFALATYNGDPTHQTLLTGRSLELYGMTAGMALIGEHNAVRNYSVGSPRSLLKLVGFMVRDFLELLLGVAYFGRRLPLDPNIVVILQRDRP